MRHVQGARKKKQEKEPEKEQEQEQELDQEQEQFLTKWNVISFSSIETTVDDWYYHLILIGHVQGARKMKREQEQEKEQEQEQKQDQKPDLRKCQII